MVIPIINTCKIEHGIKYIMVNPYHFSYGISLIFSPLSLVEKEREFLKSRNGAGKNVSIRIG